MLIDPKVIDTLVAAAKKRNDETLLRCIEGENRPFKGFHKHSSCYVAYTCILYERTVTIKEDKYEKVKEAVGKQVLGEGKCLSLDDILVNA